MNKNTHMLWSWIIWIAIVVTVLGGGYFYVGTRLIGTMGWSQPMKTVAWIALGVMLFIPFASMFVFRFMEGLGTVWAWVTYVGLGFLSLVVTFLLVRDITLLAGKGFSYLASVFAPSNLPAVDTSRRTFLLQTSNLIILGAAGTLTAYGIYQARRTPGIVDLTIPLKNLPEAFEGFRIVQITDIHAGLTVKRDWIETVARVVRSLKPDLIAFTGDLADGTVSYLRKDVAPLGELQAPDGKFFVTGNHEYYSGVGPWVAEAQRLGYDVLLNEHRIVRRNGEAIVVAGVTDQTANQFTPSQRPDPAAAIANAPADAVKILLAHQPRTILESESLGYDLLLTGHTHGGQFFPWNLVATLGQPYIKGLHRRRGTWIYVSKGTGYWGPPVRLGARSEITVLTLTRDREESDTLSHDPSMKTREAV